jgi:hypothetical protein
MDATPVRSWSGAVVSGATSHGPTDPQRTTLSGCARYCGVTTRGNVAATVTLVEEPNGRQGRDRPFFPSRAGLARRHPTPGLARGPWHASAERLRRTLTPEPAKPRHAQEQSRQRPRRPRWATAREGRRAVTRRRGFGSHRDAMDPRGYLRTRCGELGLAGHICELGVGVDTGAQKFQTLIGERAGAAARAGRVRQQPAAGIPSIDDVRFVVRVLSAASGALIHREEREARSELPLEVPSDVEPEAFRAKVPAETELRLHMLHRRGPALENDVGARNRDIGLQRPSTRTRGRGPRIEQCEQREESRGLIAPAQLVTRPHHMGLRRS